MTGNAPRPLVAMALLLFFTGWSSPLASARLAAQQSPLPTVVLSRIGSIAGPADLVQASGTRLMVAGGRTLTLFDLGDPAMPKRMGAFTFADTVSAFKVVGTRVYAAIDLAGLAILDVSAPSAPRLLGTFKTPGQAHGVAVSGSTVLVADHMSGVDIIDISNPERPVSTGAFFLEGYARDVAVSGTTAYAVDSPNSFYVLDLTKPGTFEPVATLTAANGRFIDVSRAEDDSGASGAGRAIVACVPGPSGLQVFDVSNPKTPVLAATFRTSGRPQRVSVSGARAFVADGAEGVQVVDIARPSVPALVGGFKTTGPARDVAVAGSLVFVVSGPDTVLILQASSPSQVR